MTIERKAEVDPDLIGRPIEVADAVWDARDVMLYALAVGAGQSDPCAELQFTTENTEGNTLEVLPGFGVIICEQLMEVVVHSGPLDAVLHAEQELELMGPLPSRGRARLTGTITSVYDKGSGALVAMQGAAYDRDTGALLLRTRSSMFVRGAGGFGGDHGPPTRASEIPEQLADRELSVTIPPSAALLYRLCGDRNPLHVDPLLARRSGFKQPILHGLCTFGYASRMLLHEFCSSDPARMGSIAVRFSAPVTPGDTLVLRAWQRPDAVHFQMLGPDGQPVLDRGKLTIAS